MPLLGLLKKNAVKPTAFFWTMVLTWTTIITLLTSRNILHIRSFHMEMARNEIRANFNKDKAFRLWAASHGGVYVPVTTKTQPSPYLKDLPERDIVTPSGRTLTLLSPAQMVRQLSQEFASIYGLKGGVTALHPVNPANTPDPWQRQALQKLADGDDEVLELTEIGGAPYLRLMRPLFVQEECLLCHQDEEIKTASTRGGANVSLPMAPYFAHQREELLRNLLSSFLFWVLGCVGIWLATDSLRRHIKERDLTATKLQQAHAELEERVRERTISLSLSNAKLGQEIAERQQAEEAARLAHAELNQIFNCNGDAMYVIARDYTVLRANDTLFDTFAVKRDAFIGKKCYDTWPTPFCRTPQCPLERILNGAKRTDYHGIDRQGADGGMVSVIVTATPLHAPGGEILGIVVTLKDISELKNAEKERSRLESRLRDSQKLEAIGTLAGGVAHDFNNILAAIIGHTELAVKQSAGDHRLADSLDKVHGAAIRGKDLIEQLLSFSSKRKRAGALLSVSTILNEVKGYLEDTLPNSIRIRQEIMPGRDLVEGDPTQIRQALLNLCANATDSMGEKGGVLELTLDSVFLDERDEAPPPALPPGHYLRLRVADSGCGMEKSVMERIFDPFFTTKGPGEGSGMGLAVAHGIVKSHGGAIRVDSMVGRGSTFTIFLPAMTGEPPPAVPRPKRSVTPAGGGENILFVDDEEVLVSMTRQFMEELGYMFTGETSSPAALARFGQNPYLFDLVITDQTMPQLSGLEMAEAMIKLRPDLPIILYTGYSEKVNQERAMEVGIKAFLMKPVSASKLAETVRAVLDGETEICSLPDHETPPVVDSQNQ